MELSMFWIYLIGISDQVSRSFGFLSFFFFLSTIGAIVSCALIYTLDYSPYAESRKELEKKATCLKWSKRAVIISAITWIIVGLISTLMPSSKTIVAMITVPAIVNNEEVQKLPSNIVQFVNTYLEENIRKYQKEE